MALNSLFVTRKYARIVYGISMAAKCKLLNFVIVILTVSLFCIALRLMAVCFCEQKTEVKLKAFQVMMTNCLWWFMQNTPQTWNQDLMAFLCTGGVEVVITRRRCAANAVLRKL